MIKIKITPPKSNIAQIASGKVFFGINFSFVAVTSHFRRKSLPVIVILYELFR